jgi:hypothetical protein
MRGANDTLVMVLRCQWHRGDGVGGVIDIVEIYVYEIEEILKQLCEPVPSFKGKPQQKCFKGHFPDTISLY